LNWLTTLFLRNNNRCCEIEAALFTVINQIVFLETRVCFCQACLPSQPDESGNGPAPAVVEAVFRLQFVPAAAGADHPRRAGGQGRLRPAADRRRQIPLLSVTRAGAVRIDRRGLPAHRVDERPGGCPASRRRGGHVPEFVTGGAGIAGAL